MSQSNQEQISVAGAGTVAVDDETPPKFFKLNIDCIDKIFDYMPLKDIIAMSGTCKVMQKVAGSYFQQNFPATFGIMRNEGVSDNIYIKGVNISPGFEEFISKLIINIPMQSVLKAESFSSLKHIWLCGEFNDTHLHSIKNILSNIQILYLRTINTTDELYEQLINCCTKLKELRIEHFNLRRIEITHNWFRKNATLERIDVGIFGMDGERFKVLLEENSTLKHVSFDVRNLRSNRNLFAESNIQLDCLTLTFWDNLESSRQFADQLMELYVRGFYKKLVLYIWMEEFSQEFINRLAPMSALQSICFGLLVKFTADVDLSPLIHLKILFFMELNDAISMNMDNLARNLVNLEKFLVGTASTDVIIPFLRNSRRLNLVKVGSFTGGGLFKNDILDVAALNQLRQNLNGARKVSIYVDENVYLATKWAMRNWDFSLVEVKREGAQIRLS